MPFEWETPKKTVDTGRKKEDSPAKAAPIRLDEPDMIVGNQAALRLLSEAPSPVVARADSGLFATVYFGRNNFLLDGANYAAVMKLADELRYMSEPSIMIDGHASGEGTAAYNLSLSEKRRQAVIALLTGKLTGKARISGSAYGESKPAVAESAAKGKEREGRRALNRRVEIFIMLTPATKPKEPEKKIDLRPKEKVGPESPKEKLDRIIKEKPPEPPPKRSLSEMFWKKFDDGVEDILRKAGVPAKFRGPIKDAARTAVEKGAEKLLDEALDRAGLNEKEKRAVKEAIKAAGETKF